MTRRGKTKATTDRDLSKHVTKPASPAKQGHSPFVQLHLLDNGNEEQRCSEEVEEGEGVTSEPDAGTTEGTAALQEEKQSTRWESTRAPVSPTQGEASCSRTHASERPPQPGRQERRRNRDRRTATRVRGGSCCLSCRS